ncbi:MAG TPA: hypothetical protein DEO85_05335 [Maritimibacter sp.]|nr:hypothetical protein [Maritimibacter sp.]
MLPHAALLLLIPAPALAALALHLRASLVMAGGLIGAAAYMVTAMTWPVDIPDTYADTYYVTGSIVFVRSLVILSFLLLVAQGVKERLGTEDRLTTVTLFLMVLIGGAVSLLPLTSQPPGTDGWRTAAANLGGTLFMAGLMGLAFVILIRPLLRRLRRAR